MKLPRGMLTVVCGIVFAGMLGCRPQQPFFLHEDGDLSHYVDKATQIEYPDVEANSLDEVQKVLPPFTISNSEVKEYWDLSLEEAARIALQNSKIIRSLNQPDVGAPRLPETTLTVAPEGTASIYDPARQETNPRTGVEAVLAEFDAQLSTRLFWQKLDTPQNVAGFVTFFRPSAFRQDLGTFQTQLSKTYATGGTFSISHNVGYEWNNATASRAWPSHWTANLQAEFRQPLLQGAGVTFNRIAGPNTIPGVYNGVLIARLETDQRLAEFEQSVSELLLDVEKAYWTLYLAYRQLDTVITGRDAALQTWRQVRAKYEVGGRGGSAQEEAQARQQYLAFRAAVEQSLSSLYKAENNLRYLMGLAATDGRLIRPKDEPTRAKVQFDFYDVHAEALVRNPLLRREKWRVKKAELELIAAKNYLLPRLDFFGFYRWNGLGHDLLDPDNSRSNAYGSLTSGDFQDWELGMELQIPIGFRKELAAVRNAQLNLARERAILQEQELEISHQIAWVLREIDEYYTLAQTNYNRTVAAENEVRAVTAMYDAGTATLDLLLNAQQRRAEAEIQYYQALTKYMFAISHLHFRKGSLLEYNGVYLTEGPWPEKAYFDALRRARARDAGIYLNYGMTNPPVFSRGEYDQHAGRRDSDSGNPFTAEGENATESKTEPKGPEVLPAPKPQKSTGEEGPEVPPLPSTTRLSPRSDSGAKEGGSTLRIVKAPSVNSGSQGSQNTRVSHGRSYERVASQVSPGDLELRALGTHLQPGRSSAQRDVATHKAEGTLAQKNGVSEVEPVAWVGVSDDVPSTSKPANARNQSAEETPARVTAESWRAIKP
ncbi:MAG: TolC family protein [Thermogutta sp.]